MPLESGEFDAIERSPPMGKGDVGPAGQPNLSGARYGSTTEGGDR